MKLQKSILMVVLLLLVVALPLSVAAQGGGEDYEIQAGDSLSKIAEAVYGDPQDFLAIVEATNQKAAEDDSYTTIADPAVISVGQKIYIPTAEEAEAILGSGVSAPAVSSGPAPVPASAYGPPIDQAKGYHVEEASNGLYWVTEGAYTHMFLVTDEGVVMVDAPPTIGPNILNAVAEVTEKPITHVVYTHSHADHIGAAGLYPADATYIAQADTADQLSQSFNNTERAIPYGIPSGGSQVPLPTVTFDDKYTLEVGGQVLELEYRGPAHEPGNIYVYAPAQKTLMLVDVVFPGWSPFKNLALAEDIPVYFGAHDEILSYDFETFVGGHMGRPGTREDVQTQKEYILDIEANAAQALQTVDFMAVAQEVGFANPWLLFDAYLDAVAQECSDLTEPAWVDKLGGVDVFTFDHCWVVMESLRID
jgi:glyoxylase-like metal-dependent hydrolase (beta-lactamase superfamily II)